jgi:hypothetical protein
MTLVADIQLKPSAQRSKALVATLERGNLKRAMVGFSGKEARFGGHTTHCSSKRIVATAERARCANGLGDLRHPQAG